MNCSTHDAEDCPKLECRVEALEHKLMALEDAEYYRKRNEPVVGMTDRERDAYTRELIHRELGHR